MAHVTLGEDYELREEGDDFVIKHLPTGNEFRYDAFDGEWQQDPPGAGSGDPLSVERIESARRNVGPMVAGDYHDARGESGGYGVAFEAEDITIHSVVVDADLSGSGSSSLPIELRQWEGGDVNSVVESATVSLDGGPQRVDLGFDIPESGSSNADGEDRYIIARGPQPTNTTPLRRRFRDEDWSLAHFDDLTYDNPPIDFFQGGHTNTDEYPDEGEESWYFFFDWLVGSERTVVQSPWSTDVDEIYVRPRDPREEFDDVSPRALWYDTS